MPASYAIDFCYTTLAVFAGVQIGLQIYRNHQAANRASMELRGPAWLARRTLEQAVFLAQTSNDVFVWAHWAGDGRGLDRVERQMLTVLRLGALAQGRAARSAEEAFESFLAYADRLNEANAIPRGAVPPTEETRGRAHELAKGALEYLRMVIEQLSELAPRRPDEAGLPLPDDVLFLKHADRSGNAAERTLPNDQGGPGAGHPS